MARLILLLPLLPTTVVMDMIGGIAALLARGGGHENGLNLFMSHLKNLNLFRLFCPKHKEIGEEIIEVVEKDGKKHCYCRKCVEEIIKKRAKEVDRWEDDLTKRDFEEDFEISPPRPNN